LGFPAKTSRFQAQNAEVHFMPTEGNEMVDQRVLSSRLFADYLDCPMKCFLRATGAPTGENIVAVAKEKRSESYAREAIIQRFGESSAIIDRKIRTEYFEARVRIVQPLRPKASSPMLTHFVPTNKVTRNDKLAATFNAMVLSKSQRREINFVRIVHGDHCTILSAKAPTLVREVGKVIQRIKILLSSDSPPDFVLNRHCPECEFQDYCIRQASAGDLRNIDKERY
jgi:CRISPR/Cas system-associated exonuclease Cas4 (RecB family)